MKKTLALVLAFALVFSTMTMAFADDAAAISADAKICADLGMLVGDGSGVTPAYTATSPNRLQAAVMFLRLKGLEAEANAFTGTDTFADAKKVAWGQPVMAYLKAHPELGWIGDGTNFDPASAMTAQQYYKVMLEALGYKQNTATVVGDFTWENVMTFAASKGLTKNAAVTSFTVNDLAVATVEALKATVKDTSKTLIATLVEAGKVDKAKAIASGVMADTTTTDAKLDAVIASANDKVEVTFDADVAKDFAENVANYKVVLKGSTTALEVKSAKAVSSTIVELATAAQTGGAAYTLTVGEVSKNFAGLAKSTAVPELDTVKCIDTNTVEIVFKKAMDRTSAEDVANYTLNNGATVAKAELWIDQDDSRQTVKLTTDGVANNKVYQLKIANVKSADLVAIKSVTKNFTGIADTKAPALSGNIIVKNNQRIWVKFDDKHGVDKATAENIANWSIDGLVINKVTAKDDDGANFGVDDYGYYDLVEIDTEPMTANHKYTLTVNNMIDGSTAKNAISKALTKTFYGVAVDKTAPKVSTVSVFGDNMVEVKFTDTNRLDVTSATDVNNYTFTEGLQVLSAKILRASEPDDNNYGKTVVLTTSTMDTDTTYKLSVENVADEFGNVMSKVSNRALARSKGADITPPAVEKIVWTDKNTVKVYFKEVVDADSATDPANYTINGDIGVVRKAALSGASGYVRVDLTTPDLANNKTYKITINGVKDRVGNETSNYVVSFTTGMKDADTDRPEIENITAVNQREIRVTFDEPVVATPDTTNHANMTFAAGAGAVKAEIVGVSGSDYTIDDNTTVVFKTDAAINTTDEITITKITGIVDLYNNQYAVDLNDLPTFYGNTDVDDAPEVVAVDQINVKKLQVTFSEPVKVNSTVTVNGIGFAVTVDDEDEETTDALSVVTLKSNSVIPYEKAFTFNFGSFVKDYVDTPSTDIAYEYTAYLDDDDNPIIDFAESVSTTKIQVHFNESIDEKYVGTYDIKDSDGKVVSVSNKVVKIDGDDDTIVNITFTNSESSWKVKPGEVYTVVPKTAARDIKGNPVENLSDLSYEFVASGVMNYDYIKGVRVVDARTIKVMFTTDFTATLANLKLYDASDLTKTSLVGTFANNGTDTVTVNLKTPLFAGTTYTVDVSGAITGKYSINGVLNDGGLSVDDGIVTFSGWDVQNYVVKVVYDNETFVMNPADTADLDDNDVDFDDDGVADLSVVDSFALNSNLIRVTNNVASDAGFSIADFPVDANYTIMVYRTTEPLTLVVNGGNDDDVTNDTLAFTTLTGYWNAVKALIDGAPVYSLGFTVPRP